MTEKKGVYLHDPKSTPAWVRVSGCDIIIGELPPGSLNVGRLGRNWSLETRHLGYDGSYYYAGTATGTVYVSGTQEGQMTNLAERNPDDAPDGQAGGGQVHGLAQGGPMKHKLMYGDWEILESYSL